MERKTVKFEVKDIDEEAGTFTGYAATFSKRPDSYGDIIEPGAFLKTIKEGGSRIKHLWNHNPNEPIGKPTSIEEDEKGLFVHGKLSLGVQRSREILALMKDGVVNEMSIGYDTIRQDWNGGIRHLKEIKLFDVSPVSFAADPGAVVLSVKSAAAFIDLPLAERDREWTASMCEKRVRAWAGGEDINWDKYSRAFFWVDSDNPELFGSYKLGFADVIGGKLIAIPRGVFAVAGVLSGARGGVNIPEEDADKIKKNVEKYYAKMRKQFDDEDIIAPWNKSVEESEEKTAQELEKEEKSGRVLSSANLEKIQSAINALQTLLDLVEKEPAPEKSTQLSEAIDEAVELKAVIAGLKAENDGFDIKTAEERIESILNQLKK